jgi:hypothetical protein
LSNDQSAELKGLGWKRLLSVVLILVIVAGGLFYVYSGSKPKSTQPNTASPFRYDEVLLDDFEGNSLGPPWNSTGYWTISTGPSQPYDHDPCYQGSYCAWSGTFHGMNSQMVLNFSLDQAWVNYSSLLLNFSLWVDTNPSDTLYVEYYNNGWNVAAQYSGHLSTTLPLNKTIASQWVLPQLELPTTTTMMRFRLTTGCCEPLYRGVFIDTIGVYMVGPSSYNRLNVYGRSDQGLLSIPVSIDNGPYYKTYTASGFDAGLTFLISPGNHTLAVPSIFSEGATSHTFLSWSDGFTTPSRPCNTPACGSVQLIAEFSPTV